MLKNLLLLSLLMGLYSHSQTDKIKFSYDTAGNQISRVLCLSCISRESDNNQIKEVITDYQKFTPEDNFSYYPNPVNEELYLKWEISENPINNIKLYNISGVLLKEVNGLDYRNESTLNFSTYPVGTYILEIFSRNGDSKTVKIIKQ